MKVFTIEAQKKIIYRRIIFVLVVLLKFVVDVALNIVPIL